MNVFCRPIEGDFGLYRRHYVEYRTRLFRSWSSAGSYRVITMIWLIINFNETTSNIKT